MRIEPAHIDQIRAASDGRMVMIDADAGNVAADLKAIDPQLKVRFAENGNPPFFAVYWEAEDGRSTYLVLTVKAFQSHLGIWTGLDQRVVERIREIDPHGRSGYDYARELERANLRADEDKRKQDAEKLEAMGEHAAHALRKDLGIKSRAFIRDRL